MLNHVPLLQVTVLDPVPLVHVAVHLPPDGTLSQDRGQTASATWGKLA
jgi:hypothetical protein